MRPDPEFVRSLAAGLITGLVGIIFFAIAHHMLIEPIWTRLGGGIPFALAGGAAMAWAFHELKSSGRFSFTSLDGALFGLLLWTNLIPVTLIASLLRKEGIRSRMGNWDTVSDVAVVFITGAIAGWLLTRAWRPTLVLGTGMGVLLLVMAGPIPIVNSLRATCLFLAFLVIYPASGVVLIAVRSVVGVRKARDSLPKEDRP
jgi:hypothetical protein